jgi:16S rRNA (guanine1516-N2)-methyltransferase
LQSNTLTSLVVICPASSGSLFEKACNLSKLLKIEIKPHPDPENVYFLKFTDTHLELRENSTEKNNRHRPLFVDFISGRNRYRRLHDSNIHQPLARAVGIKPGFRPHVLDGTAGFGRDGFTLACLGCKVTMVERSPVLGALLQDGLIRGMQEDEARKIIREQITLKIGDTKEIAKTLFPPPYSIYLDPMYPNQQKSALNKREMRILRILVGDDQDGAQLLQRSLDFAANRVVVKRPKGAPFLSAHAPTFQIPMKNSRFDVYLTKS